MMKILHGLVQTDEEPNKLWPQLESELDNLVNPLLNDYLRIIARRHRWRSYFQVRRYLKQRKTLPKELDDMIKWLKTEVPHQDGTHSNTDRRGA